MRNSSVFLSKILTKYLLILGSLLMWTTTNCENFCKSYHKNENKMIMYSEPNSTEILIIMSDNFYIAKEANNQLVFESEPIALNNDTFIAGKYSYALIIKHNYSDAIGYVTSPGFFNIKSKAFDVFDYNRTSKTLTMNSRDLVPKVLIKNQFEDYSEHLQNVSLALTVQHKLGPTTLLIAQRFDNESHVYHRTLSSSSAVKYNSSIDQIWFFQNNENQYERHSAIITEIRNFIKIIGAYESKSKVMYILFDFNDFIKYCVVNESASLTHECSNNSLRTLVDCSAQVTKSPTISKTDRILYIILWVLIGVIIIIVFGILVFVCIQLCCSKKKNRKYDIKPNKKRKKSFELASTVKTQDTQTGEYIENIQKKGSNLNDGSNSKVLPKNNTDISTSVSDQPLNTSTQT